MKNILILCTGNSCRSQMAHGYMALFTKDLDVQVYSAGVETHGLNKMAVQVMADDGVDIATYTSNNVAEYELISFDYVITVCDHARDRCPYFPTKAKMIHHSFIDPAKASGSEAEIMDTFVAVRDEIKKFCMYFVKTELNC